MWTITTKKSKAGQTWVELRELFDREPCYGSILIIVSNGDGYEYKNEVPEPKVGKYQKSSEGVNIRMSLNGSIALTFDDFDEINRQIQQAKAILAAIKEQ